MPSDLYRIELPYACYGIEGVNSIVIRAAPIAGWMVGKHLDDMTAWVKRKGGTITPVEGGRACTQTALFSDQ